MDNEPTYNQKLPKWYVVTYHLDEAGKVETVHRFQMNAAIAVGDDGHKTKPYSVAKRLHALKCSDDGNGIIVPMKSIGVMELELYPFGSSSV